MRCQSCKLKKPKEELYSAFSMRLCQDCFLRIYERKIFRIIKKFKLVQKHDKIVVALSGGKDSIAALLKLQKFIETEGIRATVSAYHILLSKDFKPIHNLIKKQIKDINGDIKLYVTDFQKEFNTTPLEIAKKVKEKNVCSICATIKRYLMNKIPRGLGFNKVATGHHMDDFIVFFIKDLLSQQPEWAAKFMPMLPSMHPKQLARIRPLFEVGGNENKLFCELNNIPYLKDFTCPFLNKKMIDVTRERWFKEIYEIEKWNKNFRLHFIKGIVKISEQLQTRLTKPVACKKCGEPTKEKICRFCRLIGRK